MITIQIFKTIPKRSTTRSKKNHDHTTHRSEDIERNIGVEGKHIMIKILGSAQESKNVSISYSFMKFLTLNDSEKCFHTPDDANVSIQKCAKV